jgi:hypothetical protein
MTVLSYVITSDDRVTGRLVTWRPPRWVRYWMLWATRLGDGWLWLGIAILLAASGDRGLRVLAGGAVAAGLANILLVLTKSRVHRTRPCERVRPAHFDVDPLTWFPSDRFSFPFSLRPRPQRLRHRLGDRPGLSSPRGAGADHRRERRRLAGLSRPALAERRPGGGPRRNDRRSIGVARASALTSARVEADREARPTAQERSGAGPSVLMPMAMARMRLPTRFPLAPTA